jgi:hypothetical protein
VSVLIQFVTHPTDQPGEPQQQSSGQTSAATRPSAIASEVLADVHALADDGWAWFVRYTHPQTGLTLDGGANSANAIEPSTQASIAASGFYLSLLPAAAERGLLTKQEARERALVTLRFIRQSVDHVKGVMLHFVHWDTGKRFAQSEYSVLDTAICLHGAIVAGRAFGGEHAKISDELIDRVEWDKLQIKSRRRELPIISYGFHGDDRSLLPHGADVRSSENLLAAILAVGSGAFPLDKTCWYNMSVVRGVSTPIGNWTPPRELAGVLNPHHGLFTSYYGLCWANLHGLHDADGIDLWANARTAALFNRAICRNAWASKFSTYNAAHGGWWGLSAGEGPNPGQPHHSVYTVPNPVEGDPNGTVWPIAALGSFPWIADELASDLPGWKRSDDWAKARGRYGLSSFSVDQNWVAEKLLGIDIGSFLVNWWNFQFGTIHRLWKAHPVAVRGLERLDFSHA